MTVNRMLRGWACAAAVAFLAGSAAWGEEPASPLDLIYNEEAIERVLAESHPDIGFLVRLKMMRAHFAASQLGWSHAAYAVAAEHVAHPRSEISGDLASALSERGLPDIASAFTAVEAAVKSGDAAAVDQAMKKVLDAIAEAEASLGTERLNDPELLAEVASTLLRTAVVEYHEAFEYSKISNLIEYQDGFFFVSEARQIIEQLAPALNTRDPAAHRKMTQALADLSAAWPEAVPPESSVLPVTAMQALVTIIELQLNKLR